MRVQLPSVTQWVGVKTLGYFFNIQHKEHRPSICYLPIYMLELEMPRCEDTAVTSNLDRVVTGSSPVALPFMQGIAQSAERQCYCTSICYLGIFSPPKVYPWDA